ncbi:efflux RND transporter periplasmic adaptor subunit [Desulfosporosinus lacus]|uniref:RND family efflux transporter, MFP subunit n=1 Tax=Desulfosporosinus lacus DSM 15449 TaxID=1121420 RepID=A0A1M6F7X3_9FIRM|nr:efflux RND transporter periplasmic adaptor subunit [Desulfosporosinus lacus]SHI93818.1 RND family efflux transporter, MFP subunit [Desulfosporosinus lacus DSM 15449]
MLTKKKVIISIAVLVVLMTGVMLLGNQEGAAEAENKQVTIEAVNNKVYVMVQQVNFIEKAAEIEFKASLEASEEGIVSSKVGGKVVQILFEEGEYIHQGEPLVKLEEKEAGNNLRAAESQLSAAQASLTSAEVNLESEQGNFERLKVLFDHNGIAKVELEKAEIAVKVAKANVEALKANVLTAQVNVESLTDSLAYTTISAPISGMMDEKSVSLGQNVDSGTILGKVKNISPINAVIEVKQTNLEDIKVGQKAKVTIGEREPLVYEGTLKSINGSADPSSRVFKGKIQLDNPDQALKPGSFAKAEIVNDQKVEIATVPLAALAGNEDSCYVYVNDQGIARKRSVIIGETEENVVVIKSGVQKGESVICTNVTTLQDGDVIEVVAE